MKGDLSRPALSCLGPPPRRERRQPGCPARPWPTSCQGAPIASGTPSGCVVAWPACLFEEEQATEEPDPDDIDKVPVVADTLNGGQLPRVPTHVTLHAAQQEGHGHQAQEDVQTVQPG